MSDEVEAAESPDPATRAPEMPPHTKFVGEKHVERLFLRYGGDGGDVDEDLYESLWTTGMVGILELPGAKFHCATAHPKDEKKKNAANKGMVDLNPAVGFSVFDMISDHADEHCLAALPQRDISTWNSVVKPSDLGLTSKGAKGGSDAAQAASTSATCSDGSGEHADPVTAPASGALSPENIDGSSVRRLFFDSGDLMVHTITSLSQYFPNLISFEYTCMDGYGSCSDWSALAELPQLKKFVFRLGGTHQGEEGYKGENSTLARGLLPLANTLEHLELGDFRHGHLGILKIYEKLHNLRFLCHVGELHHIDYEEDFPCTLDLSALTKLRVLKFKDWSNAGSGFCMPAPEEGIPDRIGLKLPQVLPSNTFGGKQPQTEETHGPLNKSSKKAIKQDRSKSLVVLEVPERCCTRKLYDSFRPGGANHACFRLISDKQYDAARKDEGVEFSIWPQNQPDYNIPRAGGRSFLSCEKLPPEPETELSFSVEGRADRAKFVATVGIDHALALLERVRPDLVFARTNLFLPDWIRCGHDFEFPIGAEALLLNPMTLQFTRCTITVAPDCPWPSKHELEVVSCTGRFGRYTSHRPLWRGLHPPTYLILEHDDANALDFSCGERSVASWMLFPVDLFENINTDSDEDAAGQRLQQYKTELGRWKRKRFLGSRIRYDNHADRDPVLDVKGELVVPGGMTVRAGFYFDGYELDRDEKVRHLGTMTFDFGGKKVEAWNHQEPRRLLFNTFYGDTRDALFHFVWKKRTGNTLYQDYLKMSQLILRESGGQGGPTTPKDSAAASLSEPTAEKKAKIEGSSEEIQAGETELETFRSFLRNRLTPKLCPNEMKEAIQSITKVWPDLAPAHDKYGVVWSSNLRCEDLQVFQKQYYLVQEDDTEDHDYECDNCLRHGLFVHTCKPCCNIVDAPSDIVSASADGANLMWELGLCDVCLIAEKSAAVADTTETGTSYTAEVYELYKQALLAEITGSDVSASQQNLLDVTCWARNVYFADWDPDTSAWFHGNKLQELLESVEKQETELVKRIAQAFPMMNARRVDVDFDESGGSRSSGSPPCRSRKHLLSLNVRIGENFGRANFKCLEGFVYAEGPDEPIPQFLNDLASAVGRYFRSFTIGSENATCQPQQLGSENGNGPGHHNFASGLRKSEYPFPHDRVPFSWITFKWADFFLQCRYIRAVQLDKCLNFDDPAFEALATSCPHLEKLYVSGFTRYEVFKWQDGCGSRQKSREKEDFCSYENFTADSIEKFLVQTKSCCENGDVDQGTSGTPFFPSLKACWIFDVSGPHYDFDLKARLRAARPNLLEFGYGDSLKRHAHASDFVFRDEDEDDEEQHEETAPQCKICLGPLLKKVKPNRKFRVASLLNPKAAQIDELRPCGHQFHHSCIASWKSRGTSNNKCPVCRSKIEECRTLPPGVEPRTEWTNKIRNSSICEVKAIQKKPELNGEKVVVRSFDFDTERYVCDRLYSDAGTDRCAIKLKESNLSFLRPVHFTLQEVQQWVDECPAKMRLCLPKGEFQHSTATTSSSTPSNRDAAGSVDPAQGCLVVRKAITLCGIGDEETKLDFPKFRFLGDTPGGSVLCSDICLLGNVEVLGEKLQSCTFRRVTINCRGRQDARNVDALHLNGTTREEFRRTFRVGTVLLEKCKILGGSDGVHVDCPGCKFKGCEVAQARCRGLFVSEDCTVEDCTIHHCGSYGVKTRASLTRLGRNRIQAGPWDNQPWNDNQEDGGSEYEDDNFDDDMGFDFGGGAPRVNQDGDCAQQ
ncbi:unnamed protein product [Amoebophrya sp. A120]|nr:unnamed protein product [Amoebophrya sp. A120]|eukprot:GSA120T00018452001.1